MIPGMRTCLSKAKGRLARAAPIRKIQPPTPGLLRRQGRSVNWTFRRMKNSAAVTGAVAEAGDFIARLHANTAEAAWRGNDAVVLIHLKQALEALRLAWSAARAMTFGDGRGE